MAARLDCVNNLTALLPSLQSKIQGSNTSAHQQGKHTWPAGRHLALAEDWQLRGFLPLQQCHEKLLFEKPEAAQVTAGLLQNCQATLLGLFPSVCLFWCSFVRNQAGLHATCSYNVLHCTADTAGTAPQTLLICCCVAICCCTQYSHLHIRNTYKSQERAESNTHSAFENRVKSTG